MRRETLIIPFESLADILGYSRRIPIISWEYIMLKKNWFAFLLIIGLFGVLGVIGDGSPPHLQELERQAQQK